MSALVNTNGGDNHSHCQLGGFEAFTAFIVPVDLLIAAVAVAGNMLVVASVARFSILRTPTNHFVVALACSDLTVGLIIPFYVSFYFDVSYVCETNICQVKTLLSMWATLCSFCLMIGVALDRYVSIVHPLSYPRIVSGRVSITFIVSTYLYVTFLHILPYSIWPDAVKDMTAMRECDLVYVAHPGFAVLFCAHLALSLALTILLYAYIFREAWRQNRQHLRTEAKTAIMMVLIFGVSIVSTLPYLVVVLVRYLERDLIDQMALSQAKKMVLIFFFGKSAVNPFIYGWKNRDFRFAFSRLLRCFPCSTYALDREEEAMETTCASFRFKADLPSMSRNMDQLQQDRLQQDFRELRTTTEI